MAGYRTQTAGGRAQCNAVAVGEDEARAMARKSFGASQPDSAAGAGNKNARRAVGICHVSIPI
jgi:hypothetical protein